ncbi:DUF6009 family protein [Streptomyces camelliae]|uniref:DUF6009 family protein n=1 Tax=Streptomyces camelliae TaxID=3004093 RepID=A0ABY7PGP2_9ACTN|nr:DUF6009 family protein [Streptomyces sp. HUAS 2-6]WBO68719.1 DUF6009 family protein [Streptomyces sp. HUAS 2-6]
MVRRHLDRPEVRHDGLTGRSWPGPAAHPREPPCPPPRRPHRRYSLLGPALSRASGTIRRRVFLLPPHDRDSRPNGLLRQRNPR